MPECAECGDHVEQDPATVPFTVPWADAVFCSRECRSSWANRQVDHDLF